ncbi:MAG: hypothetical protein DHS20C18_09970 [Saprospiraceae bacterium]|nr:MAG: hypothetical protein DHS20C18_09970 [Saprospiraceae bacterium]
MKLITINKTLLVLLLFFLHLPSFSQDFENIPLNDLSAFAEVGKSWKIVEQVTADLVKTGDLKTKSGSGILVNLPGGHGQNLTTKMQHGDIDLELEFMMAKSSNSGIYLQGTYELQLLDSWGVHHPGFGDCGGVYERWDESKPDGRKGFQGYAPRLNACRAPGLWQKLEISFQAARFDQYGHKTAPARLLKVVLNGTIIHENLELTGPTRGGGDEERAQGPIRLQGDHGSVAFRNIRYRKFNNPPLKLEHITYEVFQTDADLLSDLDQQKLIKKGKTEVLTHEVTGETSKFALRFRGDFNIVQAGRYDFSMDNYGMGQLLIDGKSVAKRAWRKHAGSVELNKGNHSFEISYAKMDSWYPNGLALYVSGPGVRLQPLHTISSEPLGQLPKPYRLDFKNEPVLLRSFVDVKDVERDTVYRVTHAISVGFPEQVSYHYNLSNGALFDVWKAEFLNLTPMLDSRGDGSSIPLGSVLNLRDAPAIAILAQSDTPWPEGTNAGENFRNKGYRLDKSGAPTFKYLFDGKIVLDQILPREEGRYFNRKITVDGALSNGYHRAARAKVIEEVDKELFRIDGTYYIRLPEKSDFKATIRLVGEYQELLLPLSGGAITYDLIW